MKILSKEEINKVYEEQITKISKNFKKSLLFSLLMPGIIIIVFFMIIFLSFIIFGKSFSAALLSIMMSLGIIILSIIIFTIFSFFYTIKQNIFKIIKLIFQILTNKIEEFRGNKEIDIDKFIDEVLEMVIIPKINFILKTTFKYIGYKWAKLIEKYVEIILKESLEYVKNSINNKELTFFLELKIDRYREAIVIFLQNELYDLEYSGGKYLLFKLNNFLVNKIKILKNKDSVRGKIIAIQNQYNNFSFNEKYKILSSIKAVRIYDKILLILGFLGGIILSFGIIQIVLLTLVLLK